MKKLALLMLFLCFCLSFAGSALADTANWCGTYFEEDGRAFLRLARDDFGIGSSSCNQETYDERTARSGTANIALDFSGRHSTLGDWRKFNNHLIEIRGKYRNGYITRTRFVRDMGI